VMVSACVATFDGLFFRVFFATLPLEVCTHTHISKWLSAKLVLWTALSLGKLLTREA